MEAPTCGCHGVAMYWHKKNDRASGGLWRCTVRKREVQNAKPRDPASQRRYWHKADGGYVRRRRRHLNSQRTHVLDQLAQLEREAASCR